MAINLILPSQKNDNAVEVTSQILDRLQIAVTKTTIASELQEHPDYPSLLSISDALSHWKVNNACLQVDPENLNNLTVPFIAHLKSYGGLFVTVNAVSEKEIIYGDTEKNNKQIVQDKEGFLKEWTGVVLVAETTNESGEKNYQKQRRKEIQQQATIPFILFSCILLIALFSISTIQPFNASTILISALAFVKFAGCIITSLLLWYEVDQSNPFLQQICSAGKNTNCKAVLQSKEAKLFGIISWSEIGFFYFAGSFLYLLIYQPTNGQRSSVNALAWLNLLTLPYTVFSIYYQWRIAKQWCVLCLTVQVLLITEFIICYFVFWHQHVSHSPLASPHLLLSFLLPVFFWSFAKKFLLKAKAGEKYKIELNRLKHNPQIFEALLQKQKTIITNPEGLGIAIGNLNATNTIIKVCNPYCGPCAKVHPAIEELLKENDNIKVQIIFNATDDEKDSRSKPVKHLMAIYEKNDSKLIQQALDDWYIPEKKDYETFSAKYPMNGELKLQKEKLALMFLWCKENEIAFTPTFFINGKQLPEIYSVNDLKYFLAE